ncbi:TIGR02594 family protein [Roseomonas chloroacetimidivorans]|jgi:uncharacterized protein (TIGR02594 family)|uniref:TIGR02594 family protein n=1 Tax=Roseomonas chloroacetimidivorans TaxID=1766656 RepID=UPI003C71D547
MNTSEALRQLQRQLNSVLKPSPGLVVDGKMGPKTRAALARYSALKEKTGQNDGGLVVANDSGASPPAIAGEALSERWMSIAQGELGTAEIAGALHNPRIVEYHSTTTFNAKTDEVAWCSSFVNWVIRKAGYVGTNNALASSWMGWGMATEPRYGAITVIKRKGASSDAATGSNTGFHVGFMIESKPTRIKLLGGNQSNRVKLSPYDFSEYEVKAVRWPV